MGFWKILNDFGYLRDDFASTPQPQKQLQEVDLLIRRSYLSKVSIFIPSSIFFKKTYIIFCHRTFFPELAIPFVGKGLH
jgi:hypothetical protein